MLLQEEVVNGENVPPRGHAMYRSSSPRYPLAALPTPHVVNPKLHTASTSSDDSRGLDAARAVPDNRKIAALRAFCRARGLCFKCGERWGKDHTCPISVQLHIVEELLSMLNTADDCAEEIPDSTVSEEENLCILSCHALDGSLDLGVIQLHAWLQGQEVLILVDSGSSTSFVDQGLLPKLSGIQFLPKSYQVKVANGALMQCNQYIPNCS